MKKILLVWLLVVNVSLATEVQMTQFAGTYNVPVRINDQITLNFVVDSGAGEVQIPSDVIFTLIRTGTISDADFLPSATYSLADGKTAEYERVSIKQLQVGDQILYNVVAIVGKVEGVLLLGQSFLQRFTSWSINNGAHTLILGEQIPITAHPNNTNIANIQPTAPKSVAWMKFNDYGILTLATDSPCQNPILISKGYQFIVTASIPIARLKTPEDAYFKNENYAMTVIGCWSPKMHKAYWHRKHDGKEWETDFMVDNTWAKTEQ